MSALAGPQPRPAKTCCISQRSLSNTKQVWTDFPALLSASIDSGKYEELIMFYKRMAGINNWMWSISHDDAIVP